MSNTLLVKDSEVTVTPPSLAQGEIAYSFEAASDALFIGAPGSAVKKIGGAKDVAKLAAIEAEANKYIHATHPADSPAIDTGPLTGATVISDLDLNVTTDTEGHVTDANASVATRVMTLADLGYTGSSDANTYVHPSHTPRTPDIDTGPLTGATVISDLDINISSDASGHVTAAAAAVATRTMTLLDLGYTGETDATADQIALEVPYTPAVGGTFTSTNLQALGEEADAAVKSIESDLPTNYLNKTTATAQTVTADTTFSGDVTVVGDFAVEGTVTNVNSTDLNVEDNEIVLNSGETGAGVTAVTSGLTIERGTATNARLVWDDSVDQWMQDKGNGTLIPMGDYTAGDGLTLTGQAFSVNSTVARTNASNTFAASQIIQGDLTGNGGNLDGFVIDGGSF